MLPCLIKSGEQDSNLRPHAPQTCALPGCATARKNFRMAKIIAFEKKSKVLKLKTHYFLFFSFNLSNNSFA
jgi:hypothetical protein